MRPYRSVVGPLVLIVIGGVFLINNLRPDLSLVHMIARYWPFLLILWGVLRLAEILFLAATNKPLPARGIGGGEWVLIVFLCMAGSGAFFVFHHGVLGRMDIRSKILRELGEAYDYTIDEQKAATGKSPKIVIENFRGNARVVAGDGDEVKVSGRKTIRSFQRSDADHMNTVTKLELVNQGEVLLIRTNQERMSADDRQMSADLDITVPKGASVEARGRFGDFDINGIGGNVDVNSDNAGVRLQDIGGSVRLDLRRSDIIRAVNVKGPVDLKGRGNNIELENIEGQVTVNGTYFGEVQLRNLAKPLRFEGLQSDIRVEKCPGQIRMARGYFNATNVVGPVQISANSKDIQISEFTQSLDLRVERGDIALRSSKVPLSKMDVHTRSGDIDVAVPAAAKFDLRASVSRGEIQNEFGDVLRSTTEGRGATLKGSTGDGPALVFMTERGTVIVRKSSPDQMTLEPKSHGPSIPRIPAPPRLPMERN
ncbi:MAG TPA: DUF4097 family beta strand repeat-containing protein [Bryobacteraceae bacterium]|nr:DUF4097 family beta strand repeat-containing protein [Bryobacteraceae bacterium]